MKNLSTTVLPFARVLLNYCNESLEGYASFESDGKKDALIIKRVTDVEHDKFSFYQIVDQNLIIRIAVLKENTDSIIPYQYFDDEQQKAVVLVRFSNEGVVCSADDVFYQRVFTFWVKKWFEILNDKFKLA